MSNVIKMVCDKTLDTFETVNDTICDTIELLRDKTSDVVKDKKIFMLVGSIGSGKTTAACYITYNYYNFEEFSFAEPIKEFAVELGFDDNHVYGDQKEKKIVDNFWNISPREFLQKFGTEVCRDKLQECIPNMNLNGRTLWARVMEQKIQNNNNHMIISDGRFKDEEKLIRDYNGIIIRIDRTVDDEKTLINKHSSEQYINEIQADYVIDNNGTKEKLFEQIDKILEKENLKKLKKCPSWINDLFWTMVIIANISIAVWYERT